MVKKWKAITPWAVIIIAAYMFAYNDYRSVHRSPPVVPRVTSSGGAYINNLRLLDSAKKQWAMENQKSKEAVPKWEDMKVYVGRGTNGILPTCPDNGIYTLGRVNQHTTCSFPGHVLKD